MLFQSLTSAYWSRRLGAVAMLFLLAPTVGLATASAAGIFSGMAGAWRGDGSIKYVNGQSEGMRCTAENDVSDDGNKVLQVLTCAFASGGSPLKIRTDISYREAAGVVKGFWSESSYGVHGEITGNIRGGTIRARVKPSTTQNITVDVEVVTQGATQTITLHPTNYDVKEVSVRLRKS